MGSFVMLTAALARHGVEPAFSILAGAVSKLLDPGPATAVHDVPRGDPGRRLPVQSTEEPGRTGFLEGNTMLVCHSLG